MFEGKVGKAMMIHQGYVPAGCTLWDEVAGPLIWSEINAGRSPCDGCNHDRAECGGKPADPAYFAKRQAEEESLRPGDRVVETGNSCMKGRTGTVYISDNELTRGSLCVLWDGPQRMGTSVTHGTRKLAPTADAY